MFEKKMYYEKERLKTFNNWPLKDCCCNPSKMAEAGWYACDKEQDDLSQCFFCDKQLDGWEPQDDPWEEHRKHSPQCVFVALGKREADITVKEQLDLLFEVDKRQLTLKVEELKEQLGEEKEKVMKKCFPNERKLL